MLFSRIFFIFLLLTTFNLNVAKAEDSITVKDEESAGQSSDSNPDSFYSRVRQKISGIWQDGNWEIHIPIYAWHNRESYPRYKIDNYNENPRGIGIGKYITNQSGNRERVLAIGFSDSNYHFEPLVLYTWQKIWRDRRDFFRFSVGYMAGFTTRKEWHWVPIPMALPIVSIEAGPLSFENTYIPGLGKDNGNVWFSWASIRF